MKTLLFAVFLAVVQTPPPVPRKAADNPTSASHKLNSQASPDKPAPTAPPPVVNVETPKENENTGDRIRAADAQKSVRISELPSVSVRPGWRDDASLFFSLTLVIVTAIQAYLLCYTLKFVRIQSVIMRRQTKATESAAKAALENIELLIKKERATLAFKLNDIEWNHPPVPPSDSTLGSARYEVLFFGYTPAYIVDMSVWAFVDASKEPPTETRQSSISIPKIVSSDTELPVQIAIIWPIFSKPEETEAIRKGRSFVHITVTSNTKTNLIGNGKPLSNAGGKNPVFTA